jgi:transporter family protein
MSWVIYALLSAVFASLVAIFGKIGIKGVDSNLAVAIRTLIIVFFAWGIVLAEGTVNKLHQISWYSYTFIFLSAIATGLSWLFYYKALQMGEASRVAPIDKLSVAIADRKIKV